MRYMLWLVWILVLPSLALATPPNVILHAEYEEPTRRYNHGVLGDKGEWGALRLTVDMCINCAAVMIRDFVIRLPTNRVFEDTAPRLIDLDDDGSPEVVVVESDLREGARLAIYYESGLWAATPFIGQSHRWLAPVGFGDFNGDGYMDIAYIDRPHLSQVLRVWSYREDELVEIASKSGLTNHKIGWDFIAGGVRDCGQGPEIITADGEWRDIVSTRMIGSELVSKTIGAYTTPESLTKALEC